MSDDLIDFLIDTDSIDEYINDDPKCPKCGSKLIRIAYGYPGDEMLEQAQKGEIILGGCCVFDDQPVYRCTKCNISYDEDLKKK